MFRILVTVLFTLSSVTSAKRPQYSQAVYSTAASNAQIKFANENGYDDTGPAQRPVNAYNTYSNLEDALIAYLDDPDTKLPEHERAKGIHKLISKFSRPPAVSFSKNQNYFGMIQKPKIPVNQQSFKVHTNKIFYPQEINPSAVPPKDEISFSVKNLPLKLQKEPFKFQKIQSIKGNPLTLGHYTRDPDLKTALEQFNSFPKYSYSYGVHDKNTGDMKQAAESRHGDLVRGFYSFLDSDGKQRIVYYTAGDVDGFRASVKKLPGVAN